MLLDHGIEKEISQLTKEAEDRTSPKATLTSTNDDEHPNLSMVMEKARVILCYEDFSALDATLHQYHMGAITVEEMCNRLAELISNTDKVGSEIQAEF